MESKQTIEYEFDAEKVMEMTREEAISLLGDENATRVNEGLQNGTLSYSEFERICQERFPIPQQAKLVRNVIFNQLSKTEGFNMFESNKEKQAQYAEIVRFREKAENGELTQEELKQLCDKVFGKDSDMSKKIQGEFVAKGKVKQSVFPQVKTDKKEETRIQANKETKKLGELEPEEKTRIQKETAKIAQKHREQQEQQKQEQNQELQQGQANKQGGEFQQENTEQLQQGQAQVPVQPQQPMMDMGGMEL